MRKTGQHRGATLYGMTVDDERSQPDPVVVVLMGVSGSGKTTVAAILSEMLHWDFEEGDALHPEANVKKMAAGEPLTDTDRWPWLDIVEEWMAHQLGEGRSGIITCSALKRSYRDVLRRAGASSDNSKGSGSITGTGTGADTDTDSGAGADTGADTGTGADTDTGTAAAAACESSTCAEPRASSPNARPPARATSCRHPSCTASSRRSRCRLPTRESSPSTSDRLRERSLARSSRS